MEKGVERGKVRWVAVFALASTCRSLAYLGIALLEGDSGDTLATLMPLLPTVDWTGSVIPHPVCYKCRGKTDRLFSWRVVDVAASIPRL